MAAELPETEIRIVLISFSDGRTKGLPVGAYLASYDPEGEGGNGIAIWMRKPRSPGAGRHRHVRRRAVSSGIKACRLDEPGHVLDLEAGRDLREELHLTGV
jgi:hypothetical protein